MDEYPHGFVTIITVEKNNPMLRFSVSVAIGRFNISDIVVGDCLLCARQAADGGPGLRGDLTLSSWETAAGRGWWPLAVAGGELVSLTWILEESRRVFNMR